MCIRDSYHTVQPYHTSFQNIFKNCMNTHALPQSVYFHQPLEMTHDSNSCEECWCSYKTHKVLFYTAGYLIWLSSWTQNSSHIPRGTAYRLQYVTLSACPCHRQHDPSTGTTAGLIHLYSVTSRDRWMIMVPLGLTSISSNQLDRQMYLLAA